jgi:hypothetical protein
VILEAFSVKVGFLPKIDKAYLKQVLKSAKRNQISFPNPVLGTYSIWQSTISL